MLFFTLLLFPSSPDIQEIEDESSDDEEIEVEFKTAKGKGDDEIIGN